MVITLTIGQLFPSSGVPSWSGMFSFLHTQATPAQLSDELEGDVKMSVHVIDVGQADSILVMSGEHAALIDAGENGCGEIVLDYLKKQGIKKLDIAVATHPHSDHVGGMDVVLRHIPADTIIMPDVPEELIPSGRSYSDFLDAAAEAKGKGTQICRACAGDAYTLGDTTLTILSPTQDCGYIDLNDWSVSLLITCDKASFFTAGDISSLVEDDIMHRDPFLTAQLVKLSHHGSSASNSEAMLRQLHPAHAVISVGKNNDYGHPSKTVLNRLKKLGIEYRRTDTSGTLVYYTDGKTFAAA